MIPKTDLDRQAEELERLRLKSVLARENYEASELCSWDARHLAADAEAADLEHEDYGKAILPALLEERKSLHAALESAITCGLLRFEQEDEQPTEDDPGLLYTPEPLIYATTDIQRANDHPELTAILRKAQEETNHE